MKKAINLIITFTMLAMASQASNAACVKPKVTGYNHIGCLRDGLSKVLMPLGDNSDNMKHGYVNKARKLAMPMSYYYDFGQMIDNSNDFVKGKAYVMDMKEREFCINTRGKEVSCK